MLGFKKMEGCSEALIIVPGRLFHGYPVSSSIIES